MATLGEGGASVTSLLVWHSLLLAVLLLVWLRPGEADGPALPGGTVLCWFGLFVVLAVAGAFRAPYAYAAWLVLLELAAFCGVALLGAASGAGWASSALPALQAAAALHGIHAIYQRVALGDSRPASTFLNTNHMSAWLVAVLLLGAACWGAASSRRRVVMLILGLPAATALALSSSRGALFGAAAGCGWLAARALSRMTERQRRSLAVAAAAVVIGALWLQWRRIEGDPFIHHRPQIWRHSLGVLADDLWWGSGPGQFAVAAERHRFDDGEGPLRFDRAYRMTHSDVLRVPCELGVPASAVLAIALALAAAQMLRRRRDGVDDGALAVLVALAAQALVDNPSSWPAVRLLAAALVGRLLAERREIRWRVPIALRAGATVVVAAVFLALEVGPTLAWLRASADGASADALREAARLAPMHPLFPARLAVEMLPPADSPDFLSGYGAAREQAERAIRLQPADPRYRLTAADVEARACLGRFRDVACRERTLAAFDAAASRSPFDATVRLQAAEFARHAGAPGTAADLARAALVIEPNAVPARLVLAEAILDADAGAGETARQLVAEAAELAARWPGAAQKSGYARVLLTLDAARATRLVERAGGGPAGAGRDPDRVPYAAPGSDPAGS